MGYPASDIALLGAVFNRTDASEGDQLAVESLITLPWNG
jgi:hypothetical protein